MIGIALVGSVFTNVLTMNLPAGLVKEGSGVGSIPPLSQISDPTLRQQAAEAYMTAFHSVFLVVFPVSILAGICYTFVRVEVGAKELRRLSQEKKDLIIVLD